MFSCRYDGHEEECRASSPKHGSSSEEADTFEDLMKKELQSDVLELSSVSRAKNADKPKKTQKSSEQTDDDLLYDPNEDDDNAEWMKNFQATSHGDQLENSRTDAVLNCPGCMSLLSTNCQRHSRYKTQYRTLFTFNCKVDESEVLHRPTSGESSVKQHTLTENEQFHRVLCNICDTPVGLRDSTGVYHLFGILASHS
ncbi:hypothetical protein AAHC03_0737 [Spirometra sp. Aus1]